MMAITKSVSKYPEQPSQGLREAVPYLNKKAVLSQGNRAMPQLLFLV